MNCTVPLFAEDRAMVGGFAKLGEYRVVVIGTQKGRDTKENILRNFGCAHPEGYRKALRLMRLANKFGLPIITLMTPPARIRHRGAEDTPHAPRPSPSISREMMLLESAHYHAVIGEGGSGGALGIGHRRPRVDFGECLLLGHQAPRVARPFFGKTAPPRRKPAEALKSPPKTCSNSAS